MCNGLEIGQKTDSKIFKMVISFDLEFLHAKSAGESYQRYRQIFIYKKVH